MSDVPSPGAGDRSSRRWRLALGLAVTLLLGLGALWAWRSGRPRPDPDDPAPVIDPRLDASIPYRNVRPEVKYVGDQVCADCHEKEAASYAAHPMGRALAPVAEAAPIERYGPAAFDPFQGGLLHYAIRRDKGRQFHREWSAEGAISTELEAHYAIGSGARARSYAISRDGYLFQSPLTWYPHATRWGLSPSYEVHNQHFTRPIVPTCLFCHCTQADPVEGTVNRYRPPIFRGLVIGCERCHGPGELHVKRRQGLQPVEGLDDTIVNPARLPVPLREAVCEQCHLQGEQRIVARGRADFDFRPGLPLHLFLMDFVNAHQRRGENKFVSSVEQMRASKCYSASAPPKKLGCTTCHDPHAAPAERERVAHYRAACLKCHTEKSCALSPPVRRGRQADDSCIACHMPRISSGVDHTSSTDHRVPRRGSPATGGAPPRVMPGPDDLVPFHDERNDPADAETARNHGLALMAMLNRRPPDRLARDFARKAIGLLDEAVRRDRDDVPARAARADALWLLERREEARDEYARALRARPGAESIHSGAAKLALEMNHLDEARRHFERAVEINPYNSRYHHGLAVVSFRRGEMARGARECAAALRLEPTNTATRSLLVQCHLALGEKAKAQKEYETIRALTPDARRFDLRQWYLEQVERLGK